MIREVGLAANPGCAIDFYVTLSPSDVTPCWHKIDIIIQYSCAD